MNIRPRAGETADVTISSLPQLRPVSQELFLPRGCSCPRLVARLGLGRGEPELCPLPTRHVSPAVFAAVEAYNRAHPKARLPRPAARLLATMFADQDVCCLSQQALMAEGFGNSLRRCSGP